jgi:ankyrin repeat protein
MPTRSMADYVYIRLLEFMDKSNEYCKTLKTIEIGDPEKLKQQSILGKETPIEYFKEVIRRCSNGEPRTKNILIPLIMYYKDHIAHRNTLIVTPDDKVYRLEPNHKREGDEIQTILIRYFKDSGYKYSSHFKPETPRTFCNHGGFCNVMAVLHYFIDITEASQVKKVLVDYFKWEYMNLYNKRFVYPPNPLQDIINSYVDTMFGNDGFKKLRISKTGNRFNDVFREFKINGTPSSDTNIFNLKPDDKISFKLNLDSDAEFVFSSENKVGNNSSVKLTQDQVTFLKNIHDGKTKNVEKYTGDINFKNEDEQTPLMFACKTTFLPIIQNLVERGAEINAKDTFGNTPLHFAVERGGAKFILDYLLSKGADPNIKNNSGKTPIEIGSQAVKAILSTGNTLFGGTFKLRSVEKDILYLLK